MRSAVQPFAYIVETLESVAPPRISQRIRSSNAPQQKTLQHAALGVSQCLAVRQRASPLFVAWALARVNETPSQSQVPKKQGYSYTRAIVIGKAQQQRTRHTKTRSTQACLHFHYSVGNRFDQALGLARQVRCSGSKRGIE